MSSQVVFVLLLGHRLCENRRRIPPVFCVLVRIRIAYDPIISLTHFAGSERSSLGFAHGQELADGLNSPRLRDLGRPSGHLILVLRDHIAQADVALSHKVVHTILLCESLDSELATGVWCQRPSTLLKHHFVDLGGRHDVTDASLALEEGAERGRHVFLLSRVQPVIRKHLHVDHFQTYTLGKEFRVLYGLVVVQDASHRPGVIGAVPLPVELALHRVDVQPWHGDGRTHGSRCLNAHALPEESRNSSLQ